MLKLFKLSAKEQIIVQVILLSWAVVVFFPFFIAIINSLKESVGEVYSDPFAIPEKLAWGNYVKAWVNANFASYFANSAIISLSSVVIVLVCSSSTAFVLTRFNFKGSKFLIACYLIGILIPVRLALTPLFTIVRELGLLDSLLGVILVQSASMMPVAVFILSAFFKSIPKELDEAGKMDGAYPISIFIKIMLPLLKPALATIALLSFIQSWNEYFIPLIFLQSADLFPLTIGITQFKKSYDVQWNLMFSGILIMMIPTITVFLLASKQFIEGLTQGGIKE